MQPYTQNIIFQVFERSNFVKYRQDLAWIDYTHCTVTVTLHESTRVPLSYWLMTSSFDHIRIYFATLDHPRLRPCIASFNLTLTSKERKHIWYSILFYLFLQKLLVFNPSMRMAADVAMNHQYFNDLNPSIKN